MSAAHQTGRISITWQESGKGRGGEFVRHNARVFTWKRSEQQSQEFVEDLDAGTETSAPAPVRFVPASNRRLAELESLMTDRNTLDALPETFLDLPLRPSGSGIADLAIAYEQMKLAEDVDPERVSTESRVFDGANVPPSDRDDDGAVSEAHPS